MNTFLLLVALRNVLTPALETLPLTTRQRDVRPLPDQIPLRPAALHVGSLPPKTAGAGFDAPLVLIQAMSGHDEDGYAHAQVALRLMVWNEDPETAENDLHNLLALTRRSVMAFRHEALQGCFVLEPDDKGKFAPWERPDEQAPPFVEAFVLTHWKMQGVL